MPLPLQTAGRVSPLSCLTLPNQDETYWSQHISGLDRQQYAEILQRVQQNPVFLNRLNRHLEYFRQQLAQPARGLHDRIETTAVGVRMEQEDRRYLFNLSEPVWRTIGQDATIACQALAVVAQLVINLDVSPKLRAFNIATVAVLGCYLSLAVLGLTKFTSVYLDAHLKKRTASLLLVGLGMVNGTVNGSIAGSSKASAEDFSWQTIASTSLGLGQFLLLCPIFFAFMGSPRRNYLPREIVAHPHFEQAFKALAERARIIADRRDSDLQGGGG